MNSQIYQDTICKLVVAYNMLEDSRTSLTAMQNSLSVTNIDDSRKKPLRLEIEACRESLSIQKSIFLQKIREIVQAMHNNILRSYDNVNDFLSANNISVPELIADQSELSGIIISDENINECDSF